jgi:hypothetical protein
MLTQERLKEVLNYDSDSGIFTWAINIYRRKTKGVIAGCINHEGYVQIMIDRKTYRAHRLAWLYVYGSFPSKEIDHINCIPSDNRIVNLREASREENQQNKKKAQKNNKSGLLGVSKSGNLWRAIIYLNGVKYSLGLFKSPELAHNAYIQAKRTMHSYCTT